MEGVILVMQSSDFCKKQDKKISDVEKRIDGFIYQKMREIEKYNALIKDAYLEKQRLLRIDYLNKKDSFLAISYLVSKMEDSCCSVLEVPVMLYEEDNGGSKGSLQEYILSCLVFDNNKELAIDEIKKRFSCEYINDLSFVNGNIVNRFLNVPSDNYIQLTYYKKDEEFKEIKYSVCDDFEVINLKKNYILSRICDKRYFYIIDYINSVVSYRLDKALDINFFEMKLLADVYVKNHKKNNGYIRSLIDHSN